MKKTVLLVQALILCQMVQAQVGIGTKKPSEKSILDLTATTKGFLLPRMTTTERTAINPTAIEDKGLQVFDTVTNTIWFWNGTIWVENEPYKNIYDSDSSLEENRVVAQGANTLAFTATAVDAFSIDGSTFSVDAANNRLGVGTKSPAEALDVVGKARVSSLSNALNVTSVVSALPDGTLVTNLNSTSVLGTKFVGNLSEDLPLDVDGDAILNNFKEIVLRTEVIDAHNEYNTTIGRYVPKESGYYKISMYFDIGGFDDPENDLDILIGLWDYTNDRWIARRTFRHENNNSISGGHSREVSYSVANYVQLVAGNFYGFRIYADYPDTGYTLASSRDAILKFQNTGNTGSSVSTTFSIERVK